MSDAQTRKAQREGRIDWRGLEASGELDARVARHKKGTLGPRLGVPGLPRQTGIPGWWVREEGGLCGGLLEFPCGYGPDGELFGLPGGAHWVPGSYPAYISGLREWSHTLWHGRPLPEDLWRNRASGRLHYKGYA